MPVTISSLSIGVGLEGKSKGRVVRGGVASDEAGCCSGGGGGLKILDRPVKFIVNIIKIIKNTRKLKINV